MSATPYHPGISSPGSVHPDSALIAALQDNLRKTLDPLIKRSLRCALLDFPNHGNVGDSAIWLGEIAYLRSAGIQSPAYFCDSGNYSKTRLAKKTLDGALLLHGGGNFGDLWPRHQLFREQIIRDFPDNPIIQLPQTIYFSDRTALARARAVLNQHPNLTLLVRDHRSLEIARNEFNVTSLLCPDMAFCIGPLQRPAEPKRDELWLARTDLESADLDRDPATSNIKSTDWLDDEPSSLLRLSTILNRLLAAYPRRLRPLQGILARLYTPLANQRVARGYRLLSEGRLVITDRLHAHILCMLLGIPHYLLDNSYGKIRDFHDTWTRASTLTHWCDSWAEALAVTKSAQPLEAPSAERM